MVQTIITVQLWTMVEAIQAPYPDIFSIFVSFSKFEPIILYEIVMQLSDVIRYFNDVRKYPQKSNKIMLNRMFSESSTEQ